MPASDVPAGGGTGTGRDADTGSGATGGMQPGPGPRAGGGTETGTTTDSGTGGAGTGGGAGHGADGAGAAPPRDVEHHQGDPTPSARVGDAGAGTGEQPERPAPTPEPAWEPEQWIDEGELRDEATEAVGRGGTSGRAGRGRGPRGARRTSGRAGSRTGPRTWNPADEDDPLEDLDAETASAVARSRGGAAEPDDELHKAVGPQRAARAEQRLREAGEAFRRERYEDARKLLRPLAEQAPSAPTVRELLGLTLYRLGRWAPARRELEAFRLLTGSVEQHPVLADTYRALGRYSEVEDLWDELRAVSPSAELVAEGRIVAAGALADQGRLDDAIELLRLGVRPTKRTKPHHLRVAYALADLYERAGDLPRARELFQRVASNDPDFVDVQARLLALR